MTLNSWAFSSLNKDMFSPQRWGTHEALQRKSMARQNSYLLQWRMYSNKVATEHMMTPNFFFVPLKACDTVMAGTDNSPEKIMAEWGSNAAAPLKITSEPGWSPTPTPMATRGSRRRTHRHGEADSSGSAWIGNGCWWYSVCYAMPSSFLQEKGFSVSCTQCPFLSSLMGFLCRTSWQLSLLRLVLLGSAFHVLFSSL